MHVLVYFRLQKELMSLMVCIVSEVSFNLSYSFTSLWNIAYEETVIFWTW